jgi:hypothetical protein
MVPVKMLRLIINAFIYNIYLLFFHCLRNFRFLSLTAFMLQKKRQEEVKIALHIDIGEE